MGFHASVFACLEKPVCLKRGANAVWIHAAQQVEVGIFRNLVHLGVLSRAPQCARSIASKTGAHQNQPRTIEPVPKKQNGVRVVILGQVAVGMRDRHRR